MVSPFLSIEVTHISRTAVPDRSRRPAAGRPRPRQPFLSSAVRARNSPPPTIIESHRRRTPRPRPARPVEEEPDAARPVKEELAAAPPRGGPAVAAARRTPRGQRLPPATVVCILQPHLHPRRAPQGERRSPSPLPLCYLQQEQQVLHELELL